MTENDAPELDKQALEAILVMAKVNVPVEDVAQSPALMTKRAQEVDKRARKADQENYDNYRIAALIAGIWCSALPDASKIISTENHMKAEGITKGARKGLIQEAAWRIQQHALEAAGGVGMQAMNIIYERFNEVKAARGANPANSGPGR